MAITEYASTLNALLGALLFSFVVLYLLLRLKRKVIPVTAPAAPEGIAASHAVR